GATTPVAQGSPPFGTAGGGPSYLISVAPDTFYATDENNGGVFRVNPLTGSIAPLANPGIGAYGLDREPAGTLAVADYTTNNINRIDPTTGSVQPIATLASGTPYDVAATPA